MRRRRVRCLCRACRSLRGFRGGGRKGWQEGATSTSIGQRCGPNHAMLGALDSDAATAPVVASRERIVLWQARTPAWAQERAARAMPPRVDTESSRGGGAHHRPYRCCHGSRPGSAIPKLLHTTPGFLPSSPSGPAPRALDRQCHGRHSRPRAVATADADVEAVCSMPLTPSALTRAQPVFRRPICRSSSHPPTQPATCYTRPIARPSSSPPFSPLPSSSPPPPSPPPPSLPLPSPPPGHP